MRLIDADALLKQRFNMYTGFLGNVPVVAVKDVDNAPTIDAEPVKHGRWIEKVGRAKCSVCADECWADSVMEYNYCPNCGARMDGEELC